MKTIKLLTIKGDILKFKLDENASPCVKIGSIVSEDDLGKLFIVANNGKAGEPLILSTDTGVYGVYVQTLLDALKEEDIDILDYPIGALLEMRLANTRTINSILTLGVEANYRKRRRIEYSTMIYNI